MATKIERDVLEVLEDCELSEDGKAVSLPDVQLERKLYLRVNKVLKNLGGKWNRKAKAHLFETNVDDVLWEVVKSGEYHAKLDELNKLWNFFETPRELVDRMVDEAGLLDGERVLEPSAGRGAIAEVVDGLGHPLWCIEQEPANAQFLRNLGYRVTEMDFMDLIPGKRKGQANFGGAGAIIANPPFSRGRDAKHVRRMLALNPRVVVAVASAGLEFRQDCAYPSCREAIRARGGRIEPLPAGTFKEAGTSVNAVLVIA